MEEPARWLPGLGAFARRGVDLTFLQLHDPGEWKLDFSQPAQFFSPEGGDALAVDPQAARTALRDVADEYLSEVRAGIVQWGGRHRLVSTATPLEEAIHWSVSGTASAEVAWG
jgi:hypothetical protein